MGSGEEEKKTREIDARYRAGSKGLHTAQLGDPEG